jgi:hypothetical protein
MPTALVVCPSCSRHVHVGEAACPFCSVSVPQNLSPVPQGPRRPYYGKGATALALASALAATGCGSDDSPASTTVDSGADTQTSQTDTGVAPDTTTPVDSATDETATTDATSDATDANDADVFDTGGGVPLYK